MRSGNEICFLTGAIALARYLTADDVLREVFRAMILGADAVMTQRSLDIVSMLAREDIPVMDHLGLVPRKSTWVDGHRAVGKTGQEAFELYRRFQRLEEAGAFAVEAEVIPARVMSEISARTGLITFSLGSGSGGDVNYLIMVDICGDTESPPRHARAFGNLRRLRREIARERVRVLKAFRQAAEDGSFPLAKEEAVIPDEAFEGFLSELAREDV